MELRPSLKSYGQKKLLSVVFLWSGADRDFYLSLFDAINKEKVLETFVSRTFLELLPGFGPGTSSLPIIFFYLLLFILFHLILHQSTVRQCLDG